MIRLLLSRTGLGLPTLFVPPLVPFLLTQLLPGHAPPAVLRPSAPPENLVMFRPHLALAKPAYSPSPSRPSRHPSAASSPHHSRSRPHPP